MSSFGVLPPNIAFEQGGFFYDYIMAFLMAHGGIEAFFDPRNRLEFKVGDVWTLEGKVHQQIKVFPYAIHQLAIAQKLKLPISESWVRMLVTSSWSRIEHLNDRSPLLEFFRHTRNACAHHNKFNFKKVEPRRPAEWRTVTIDTSTKGANNPLFDCQCIFGILGPGDPIVLLWDVEQYLLAQGYRA